MPAIRGKRDRIVSPEQAATLLEALSEQDRPVWATAIYAGLRAGELQALRWEDVEFLEGVIHVRHGWDQVDGEIAPKSRTGVRKVPMPSTYARTLRRFTRAQAAMDWCSARTGGRLTRGGSGSAQRPHGPRVILKA